LIVGTEEGWSASRSPSFLRGDGASLRCVEGGRAAVGHRATAGEVAHWSPAVSPTRGRRRVHGDAVGRGAGGDVIDPGSASHVLEDGRVQGAAALGVVGKVEHGLAVSGGRDSRLHSFLANGVTELGLAVGGISPSAKGQRLV
jgi:hypothetical protein